MSAPERRASTEVEPQLNQTSSSAPSQDNLSKSQSNEVEKANELEKSEDANSMTSNDSDQVEKTRGVKRIENVKVLLDTDKNGEKISWGLGICILVIAWVYALDSSTTYSYNVPASSSFNRHSMISTLDIATSIISAVMLPIIAKISDLTSRTYMYFFLLVIYVIGYIVVASSVSISAYIVGDVFVSIGSGGISFLNGVIVADLTPLKWRGFLGSMLSAPYIINTWFAGLIVDAVLATNWRWGYGMFAIIMPVVVLPAVAILAHYEHKAQKLGKAEPVIKKTNAEWYVAIKDGMMAIDAFGLLLLGFGFALLLLPFSLYNYADHGWRNRSLIAMMIVGGLLLIAFTVYEAKYAPHPIMPMRVLNRTFSSCLVIDFVHLFSGNIRGLYFSSFIWIVKDINNQQWTYYNNTLTMALCVFGLVAGAYMRWSHRYRNMVIIGLCIKILGYGITVRQQGDIAVMGCLVMAQLLVGGGAACQVVGARVASQASVPHQDLTTVIALLSLWSSIGNAIGSAISGAVWTSKLPGYLREFMPASTNATEINTYFTNLNAIRLLDYDSPERQGIITAYSYTTYYLFCMTTGLEVIALITSFFLVNYYLGDTHNAIEAHHGKSAVDPDAEAGEEVIVDAPGSKREKIRTMFKY